MTRGQTPGHDWSGRVRSGLRSVDRRIFGHACDELEDAALAAEDPAPEVVDVLGEDVLRQRGLEDPVVALELFLQLSFAPARIAGEHAPPAHRRCILLVERDETEIAEHAHRRLLPLLELAD